MNITALSQEQLKALILDKHGDLTEDANLAEIIRCELHALSITTRRVLLDRLELMFSVQREKVASVLEQLCDFGDVLEGQRGALAASPLRAIQQSEQHFLLLGTIPTQALSPLSLQHALLRRVTIDDLVSFSSVIASLQGKIASAARWAGLDTTPLADEEWLASLDLRASAQIPETNAASAIIWNEPKRYIPNEKEPNQSRRWSNKTADGPSLIRCKQAGNWDAYGWSTPNNETLRLSTDEARRTMFALDQRAKAPVSIGALRRDNKTELTVSFVLPRAEYRYVLGAANRLNWNEWPARYSLDTSLWAEVQKVLSRRLGIQFIEGSLT